MKCTCNANKSKYLYYTLCFYYTQTYVEPHSNGMYFCSQKYMGLLVINQLCPTQVVLCFRS